MPAGATQLERSPGARAGLGGPPGVSRRAAVPQNKSMSRSSSLPRGSAVEAHASSAACYRNYRMVRCASTLTQDPGHYRALSERALSDYQRRHHRTIGAIGVLSDAIGRYRSPLSELSDQGSDTLGRKMTSV